MWIHLHKDVAYVRGDWVSSHMTFSKIHSLCSMLDRIESSGRKAVEVDCRRMGRKDAYGRQFLKIWLCCLNLRGIRNTVTEAAPDRINVGDRGLAG